MGDAGGPSRLGVGGDASLRSHDAQVRHQGCSQGGAPAGGRVEAERAVGGGVPEDGRELGRLVPEELRGLCRPLLSVCAGGGPEEGLRDWWAFEFFVAGSSAFEEAG